MFGHCSQNNSAMITKTLIYRELIGRKSDRLLLECFCHCILHLKRKLTIKSDHVSLPLVQSMTSSPSFPLCPESRRREWSICDNNPLGEWHEYIIGNLVCAIHRLRLSFVSWPFDGVFYVETLQKLAATIVGLVGCLLLVQSVGPSLQIFTRSLVQTAWCICFAWSIYPFFTLHINAAFIGKVMVLIFVDNLNHCLFVCLFDVSGHFSSSLLPWIFCQWDYCVCVIFICRPIWYLTYHSAYLYILNYKHYIWMYDICSCGKFLQG